MVGFFIEMKNDRNVVFRNSNNRLLVTLSPEIKTGKDYEASDVIFAHLLSWLNSFYNSIYTLRTELGIKTPLSYPSNPTPKNVAALILSLESNKQNLLEIRSKELIGKYHLATNWAIPMQIVILTHTLLIPYKEEPIKAYIPDDSTPNERVLKGLRSVSISTVILRERRMKYPAIYFTRQVLPNELKKWIDNNTEAIGNMQQKLPNKKDFRRIPRTLFWGQVAWVLKRDGIDSWARMEDEILKMDKEKSFGNNNDSSDEKNIFDLPTAVELEKYYNRFIESLQNIEAF